MGRQKIYDLIDEAYNSFLEIKKNLHCAERTKVVEKGEDYYNRKFLKLNVTTGIVSHIYTEATVGNEKGIEYIKNNIEKMLIIV